MQYMHRRNEKVLPDWEDLDAMYHYEPETGTLSTKHLQNGEVILKPLSKFNRSVRVSSLEGCYPVSRVIWKLYYKEDPPSIVRHLNGDNDDNSIANLGDTRMMLLYSAKRAMADKDYLPHNLSYSRRQQSYTVHCTYHGRSYYGGKFKCRTCAIFALRALADKIYY